MATTQTILRKMHEAGRYNDDQISRVRSVLDSLDRTLATPRPAEGDRAWL